MWPQICDMCGRAGVEIKRPCQCSFKLCRECLTRQRQHDKASMSNWTSLRCRNCLYSYRFAPQLTTERIRMEQIEQLREIVSIGIALGVGWHIQKNLCLLSILIAFTFFSLAWRYTKRFEFWHELIQSEFAAIVNRE